METTYEFRCSECGEQYNLRSSYNCGKCNSFFINNDRVHLNMDGE